jgi:hypothetical protein
VGTDIISARQKLKDLSHLAGFFCLGHVGHLTSLLRRKGVCQHLERLGSLLVAVRRIALYRPAGELREKLVALRDDALDRMDAVIADFAAAKAAGRLRSKASPKELEAA